VNGPSRTPAPRPRAGGLLALAGVAAGLLALAPAAGAAQQFSGAVGSFDAHRLIYYHRSSYEQTGRLVGIAGTVRLWRLRLAVGTERGTLSASTAIPNSDARVRSDAASLLVALSGDLWLGVTREAWRFTADAGVTRWVLGGPVVRYEPDLGLVGLRGIADVSVFTVGGVRDGPGLSKAFRTVLGVSVHPAFIPVSIRLSHRFERIDLRAATADPESVRYEEFRGVVLEATVPARR